jgi:hypothetical protein
MIEVLYESHNALGNTLRYIYLALEALACPDTTDEEGDGKK